VGPGLRQDRCQDFRSRLQRPDRVARAHREHVRCVLRGDRDLAPAVRGLLPVERLSLRASAGQRWLRPACGRFQLVQRRVPGEAKARDGLRMCRGGACADRGSWQRRETGWRRWLPGHAGVV
jgi:hypothetical protein